MNALVLLLVASYNPSDPYMLEVERGNRGTNDTVVTCGGAQKSAQVLPTSKRRSSACLRMINA